MKRGEPNAGSPASSRAQSSPREPRPRKAAPKAPRVQCWLLKSEPSDYSIDDMAKDKLTDWDGVKNGAARANLRRMQVGDQCLFYHSSCAQAGCSGVVRVARGPYPDKADPKGVKVEVAFGRKFQSVLTLPLLKRQSGLAGLDLFRLPR